MNSYWYVLKVFPGKEKQLTEQINQQISLGRVNNIKRVVCPTEKEYVTVKKKKILRDKVIYNGYVYFESQNNLNEDELKNFSNYPNVMSILGNKLPMRMNTKDIERILKDDALLEHNENKKTKYKIGERVIINDGPFKTFEGYVKSMNDDKVDVEVSIFGRANNISLFIEQIIKIV